MPSQWECLLQNLGEWQGSFTRFSPQGELIEDTPTVVSFEGLNNNQTMRQIVRRFRANQPQNEKILGGVVEMLAYFKLISQTHIG